MDERWWNKAAFEFAYSLFVELVNDELMSNYHSGQSLGQFQRYIKKRPKEALGCKGSLLFKGCHSHICCHEGNIVEWDGKVSNGVHVERTKVCD
ncbi:unnamed protein product [Sphenostylis stenocarpa]|uniref:Uncharacterized protein n=1 Tax=Sphenostylis stenocarpa TaxID=92480 RepID=A0AA86VLL7_9FABA|nr:unnamed protein product [Sphenostylis stenocarpa]